ncbi:MAG: XRE family transcriptional regulator [Terriglobales bacterium]
MASFGDFARELRRKKELGLRDAARLMNVSPAYLSQVERDKESPSRRLMASMSQLYECPTAKIQAAAERAGVQQSGRRPPTRSVDELRALYRLGAMFTTDEVEGMVRHILQQRGMGEDDIERELAKLRADLPRIRNSGGDGLFAADIRPRVLSKRGIAQMAYRLLQRNGLDRSSYTPPTPIELIAENEEGVAYVIDDLPSSDGDPIVLGRSRWDGLEREITISADLAASEKEHDRHRFRFTLGHELFHAIEHLPLAASSRDGLQRTSTLEIGFVDRARHTLSRAERAVDQWANTQKLRRLLTREDWREWQANTFASALLMPDWAVRKHFLKRLQEEYVDTPEDESCREAALRIAGERFFSGRLYISTLAQLFDVSRQAMAIRLLDLGLVQEVQR